MNAQLTALPGQGDRHTHPARGPGDDMARSVEPVVSAAVLVATAFRLRDEPGLVTALRLLTRAVAVWEKEQIAAA